MGRTVRGNGRVVAAVVYDPDAWSRQAASLGAMTNTFSPGSAGRHTPGASPRGFVGDRGYGVNRWSGRTPWPVQMWMGAALPVADPLDRTLGVGAMPSGQPGLPSTGQEAGPIAWMSYGQLGRVGMRG